MHIIQNITVVVRHGVIIAVLFLHAQLAEALLADRPGQAAEMTLSSAWPDAIPEIPLPAIWLGVTGIH